MPPEYDYVVVGAGLFGSVFAHEMTRHGRRCLVIDKRDHIGGNCHSERCDGIDVHRYGPHIFNTGSRALWDYVNSFTRFRHYRHAVRAFHEGRLYSFPINLSTIRAVFGGDSDDVSLSRMDADRAPYRELPRNSIESWCLAEMGPTLYRMFIHGYTTKHWRKSPAELDSAIVRRLPLRITEDDNYYENSFQGIPEEGYDALFRGLLEGIEVRLGVDYLGSRDHWDTRSRKVVYTGEIDCFFDYCLGHLEWRSLRFEHTVHPIPDYQQHAIINFSDTSVPYTRSVEYRHFNPEPARDTRLTHVVREYPAERSETGEAYYPVPTADNTRLRDRYRELAAERGNRVIFGGRLANYLYIDMAPTIRMALRAAGQELESMGMESMGTDLF